MLIVLNVLIPAHSFELACSNFSQNYIFLLAVSISHSFPLMYLRPQAYELLTGVTPFATARATTQQLYRKIASGRVKYPSYLKAESASFIRALLQTKQVKRLGCGEGGE